MAEEIVRIIKVDTKNSNKSIKDLRKEINSLKKELEQTAVGSEEFESALKRLTQTQRSYNEVQQQIRDMSRTNQQDMVKFASFAKNLGKSYSALNAAIGLFASGNEDVQKAMLKVQRTIQLIQGLDGITGLVRDLPKVIAGFKSWLNALDPVERQVSRIASGINGISPEKLRQINEYNRSVGKGATTTTTTAAAVGATPQPQVIASQNKGLGEQNTLIAANGRTAEEASKKLENLGDQYKTLNEKIKDYRSVQNEYMSTVYNSTDAVAENTEAISESADVLEDVFDKRRRLADQLEQSRNGIMDELTRIKEINLSYEDQIKLIDETIAAYEEEAAKIFYANDAEKLALKEQIDNLKQQKQLLIDQNKEINKSITTWGKFKNVLKGLWSTIGWTAVATAIAIGISALIKWISKLNEASKAQREFNKSINEATNQTFAKQNIQLIKLADGYEKVGNSAAAKRKFIQDYAGEINQLGLNIKDVNTADDVFINNTNKYVEALEKRAKAQAMENAAIKIYEDYLNERYDLEQKYEEDRLKRSGVNSKESYIGLLQASGLTAEQAEQAWNESVSKGETKILDQIDKLDKKTQERLKKMFEDIAALESEYGGLFGGLVTTTTKTGGSDPLKDTREQDLKTLKGYYDAAYNLLKDSRTRELDEVKKKYDEQIALAEKYGEDTTLLEIAREREIQEILKKYRDQALEDQQKAIDEQYNALQAQIERIRRMSDTSNLREPQQQNYQTIYQQPPITRALGLIGLATGRDWTNVYQSKQDVEEQYKAQVEYNDQFYLLTKNRIEQENKLLEEQLEIIGLSADQRLEIERTLIENEIALSDARQANEEANLQAYLEAQEKRRQALNGVLEVTSTLTGSLANIAKIEAQTAEEGSERQKKATKAYKALAITQAIADTWKGANEAYTAMASIPYVGPALGTAAAIAAVISGLANVKAIEQESKSMVGTATPVSGSTVTAPAALQTPPIEYTRNLIGDKELDSLNQPIKCYILEQDVTRVQNKVKVTEDNATF